MKSILFYFNSMAPAGGIERVIATLANKFSKCHKITILVKDKAQSHYSLNPNVDIISLGTEIHFNMDNKISRMFEAAKNLILSSRKLKKHLHENKYDVYYLAHPLNVLEFHLAKEIDKSVIITEHGGIDAYNLIYKQIKKQLYSKAKAYVVPTKTDTEIYKKMGFPSIYIPHFKSEMNYLKSEQNNNIALSIGRMTEAKRQWILIDLWQKIVFIHDIKDWTLEIVGDGNLKDEYVRKIKNLGLNDYVKISPPRKDVEIYYKNASFFLLTSKSEGFGMVILEAMSFGVPSISYDCPSGPRDMIINDRNGFLVEYDNFLALEDATIKLITDKNLLTEFGSNAYNDSNMWNDKHILEKWMKILN